MTAPTPVVSAGRTPERVADHIRAAAETTGVPFDFLLAQANQESRLDPDARNRRSSAMGLFQFTRSTWLEMVKKHGAEHGLERYAEAVTWEKGGWTVKDKTLRREILELRRDPAVSALMAGEYAKENEKVLEARLGRAVSSHDLYLAHFLGATGAARVIEGAEERPRQAASGALPQAARANPEIFHEPGSRRPRSFASLYDVLQKRFATAAAHVAPVAKRVRPEIDLAGLRPEGRPEPEPPGEVAVQLAAAQTRAAAPAHFAPAHVANTHFANAIEPDSPYFPVALPPSPATASLGAQGGPVLRLMLQAMEDGKA
ncbi:MAG: transglycosylase SLT domain-containing protein [Pseudomonadota bacterium]